MRANQRIHWTIWPLMIVSFLHLWVDAMILYRIRNIDNPKEVHIMMPQMNSSAVEASR